MPGDARVEELLQRARAGDARATASLIAAMRERVFRWALVITRDSDDAEDVAQQVSLTIHRKIADYEGKSSFTTWLYTVVRNAAIELTRKAHRRYETNYDDVVAQLPAATEDRLKAMENHRAATIVRSFFTELPPRQRELIELIDNEGHSAADAARMMGIEPETARVHLLRARRTIRTRMMQAHPEMFS